MEEELKRRGRENNTERKPVEPCCERWERAQHAKEAAAQVNLNLPKDVGFGVTLHR
jgi:hypothetical protein